MMWLATCILLLSSKLMYTSVPTAYKYCLLNFCCYGKWKSLQKNISMTGSIWVKVATHNFQNNYLERKRSTSLVISHIFQRSSNFLIELYFSKVNYIKCKLLLILMKLDLFYEKTNTKPMLFSLLIKENIADISLQWKIWNKFRNKCSSLIKWKEIPQKL